MVIQWLGHSAFLITLKDGTKILTDPYQPDSFGGGLTYGPIKISPDIVVVTHEHADHNYVEGVPNHFEIVKGEGKKTVKGVEFNGVASYHDPEQGALRGLNTIFTMNADGFHLCHMGDIGEGLSPEQAAQIGKVDILMIPVGGYYTCGEVEVENAIKTLNPKVIIPMHFKTEKVAFPIAPVEKFLEGKRNVKRLDSSEVVISDLPSESEIIVLKHAL